MRARRDWRCDRGRSLIVIAVTLGMVLVFGATPSWAKDLMLKIGDLQVPAGTVVHGDVIAIGGTAYIDGTVEGDAVAVGGNVDVRGHVTGSVRAEGGSVVLRSTAVVDGAATAAGGSVRREPGASLGQGAAPQPVPLPGPPGAEQPSPPLMWWPPGIVAALLLLRSVFWFFHLLLLLAFVGTAWLVAVLFPRAIARLGNILEREPVRALAAGLIGWPIALVVTVLLAVTLVGLALVPLIPIAVFTAVQLGVTAIALLVGHRIRPMEPVQEVVVGAVILAVAFSIPGLGGLIGLAVATWGLGAVVLLLMPERRSPASGAGLKPPSVAPLPSPPQSAGASPPQGSGGAPAS